MTVWIDALLVFLALTNLALLGSSTLGTCIRLVAAQGIAIGALPLLVGGEGLDGRALALAAGVMLLKGVVVPWLLSRALREAEVRREVDPLVGYAVSLAIGVAALWLAFWLDARLALPARQGASLPMPIALFMIFTGFFLLVSRRKALTQVLGYLVLENGIYAIGLVMVGQVHVLVELGVLLDVFVAVFVMGIAIYHMNREFDHIDVDQLDRLKG